MWSVPDFGSTLGSNRKSSFRARAPLHLPPRLEGGGEGAVVEVFELAADGHPLGEAGDRDAGAFEAAPFANTLQAGVAVRRGPVPSR